MKTKCFVQDHGWEGASLGLQAFELCILCLIWNY
jgi:hypothetical protein